MSEAAQVALITGGVAFFTLMATLGFNYYSLNRQLDARLKEQQAEHEERYRVGLYEKRLEAHQQAFKWLMDLPYPLRDALKAGRGTDEARRLSTLYQEARSWWDGNCLYLDEQSRIKTIDCIEKAGMVSEDGEDLDWLEVAKECMDARRAVQEGIAMKHLDVQEPRAHDP